MDKITRQPTLDLQIWGLGSVGNNISNNKWDAQSLPAQKMPVPVREIRKREGNKETMTLGVLNTSREQ